MRVNETVRLVCSVDPSVNADPEPMAWLEADSTKFDSEALVVSVRPLTSSEVLRIGGMDSHVALEAARLCVVSMNAVNLDADTPAEVRALLERIRPAELAGLGQKILELSLLPEDPTEGAESGS